MKRYRSHSRLLLIQAMVLLSLLILAAAPALSFAQAPTTLLDRILARGYILVGTCGDYKPFTYSEKGYLMPRDVVLKAFVDQWLHLSLMDGTFQKIYDSWLK